MTTIAVNKEEIYGDRQFTNTVTGHKWKGKTKVYRFTAHPDTYSACDFIMGFAGSASDIVTISSYFEFPDMFGKPPRVRGCTGVVLTAKRDIFVFDDYTKWLLVDEPFHAIGSGAEYALGAMAAGKSPREAVKIASSKDCYTGFGIKGYSL